MIIKIMIIIILIDINLIIRINHNHYLLLVHLRNILLQVKKNLELINNLLIISIVNKNIQSKLTH